MFKEALTFDDVLLVPQYSSVNSRSEVDLAVLMGGLHFTNPIIPANMVNVTGPKMAKAVCDLGGLSILHRFMSIEDQIAALKETKCLSGVSIGVQESDRLAFVDLYGAGARIFCVDVAHAQSAVAMDMVQYIHNQPFRKDITLIAGNICTYNGAKALWRAGADVVKCGTGSGSICSTRTQTGNGVPQLTAIMEVARARQELGYRGRGIISDGGCRTPGDIVKALCFADMVMVGNMFAGCPEAPGYHTVIDGKEYKQYDGSSTYKPNHIEGVQALVPVTESYHVVLNKILDGVSSGCSYQGAYNLDELKESPEFVKVTNAGIIESRPHDVRLK